ncbi:MAG: RecX family transcriptional regulator [Alistipes sp.]|nr:RecX family transcriptional regulator [Alistipes sp.]
MCPEERVAPKPRERKSKTAEQALRSLMRLCARSEKSSGDALRLMHTWQVPQAERQGVLDRLISDRFIDDSRYAEAYVREKSRMSGWGARKIAMQLRQKGVGREVISEALRQLDGDDELPRLVEKLRRKMRTTKYSSEYELRGKLLRYALSLGFDYDMAMRAVEESLAEQDL